MRRILLLLLTACAVPRHPPPAPLLLEWPGRPGEANPRAEDHALALFPDDEWNRAVPCSRDLDASQPADPERHRCRFEHVAALRLAGHDLWLAAASYGHEWDGMYGLEQEVVVLVPGADGPTVLATLTQWHEDVCDCRTVLDQRRQAAVDLDGDGESELCVESVHEAGVGLFEVMDMDDHHQVWRPIERTRWISAFRLAGGRLVPAAELSSRCPRTGYSPFVPVAPVPDAVAARRTVQGDPPLAPCPAEKDVADCLGLATCP